MQAAGYLTLLIGWDCHGSCEPRNDIFISGLDCHGAHYRSSSRGGTLHSVEIATALASLAMTFCISPLAMTVYCIRLRLPQPLKGLRNDYWISVEIATGRISDCHCEEEQGSDVAISTFSFAPLAMTILNKHAARSYPIDVTFQIIKINTLCVCNLHKKFGFSL